MNEQNAIHLTMQGKGGVGKTFLSFLLAQNLKYHHGQDIACYDTDPVNATFSQYKALGVTHVKLSDETNRINTRNFDQLMESLLNDPRAAVVDNGASSFLPLASYLKENDALSLLFDAGRSIYVHIIVVGGQGFMDTLSSLSQLVNQIDPRVKIVVWENGYFGELRSGETMFHDTQAYKAISKRLTGTVVLPALTSDTLGADLQLLTNAHQCFHEVQEDPSWQVMAKHRLNTYYKAINTRIDALWK